MFLCNKCHRDRECFHFVGSYGRCEGCGKTAACVDCKAHHQSDRGQRPNEPLIADFDRALADGRLDQAATHLEALILLLGQNTPPDVLDDVVRRLDRLRDRLRDPALARRLIPLLPRLRRLPLADPALDRLGRVGHRLSLFLGDGGEAVRKAYQQASRDPMTGEFLAP